MKGRVQLHSSGRYWVIDWWHDGKSHKFYHDYLHGMDKFWVLHPDPDKCMGHERANRCLNIMRADWEAHLRGERAFDIQKYRQARYTDVIPYLWEWIGNEEGMTPGGKARYESAIRAWLEPFFRKHPHQLHEIQFDTFKKLIAWMKEHGKKPKTIKNTGDTLVACLKCAKMSRRIPMLPYFPKKKDYGIKVTPPVWITETEQIKIINAIPRSTSRYSGGSSITGGEKERHAHCSVPITIPGSIPSSSTGAYPTGNSWNTPKPGIFIPSPA